MAFPVQVAPVAARNVELTIDAVGAVEAFEAMEITARVAGAVERVHFREGSQVKKGDVLVEIEVARYQVAARQASAALDRALAQKTDADKALKRRQALTAKGLASEQELEGAQARFDTAIADEGMARAQLSLAQLNLRDAYVRAPIDGTLDERRVVTGEYVQPGTVLAVIVQRDPLMLRFRVPENEAVHLRKDMPVRFTVSERSEPLDATIAHVAARADATTRMVAVVAEVASPPETLRPGAFAQVSIPVGGPEATVVVPQTAVRPTERGFLCFVVKDGVAEERIVRLGLRTPDGLVAVTEGVAAGESVVVRGAEALRDGVNVTISEAAPSAPSAAPNGSG